MKSLSLFFCVFLSFHSFAQSDSALIDCNHFDEELEKAFLFNRSHTSYSQYEALVLNTLFNGKTEKADLSQLAKFLSLADETTYTYEVDKIEDINRSLFSWSYKDEFTPVFETEQYESKYRDPHWIWRISWEYFKYHTLDIKSYATLIHDLSTYDSFDMSLSCNQKAFIILLGQILGDQKHSEERLTLYEKSEPIITDFFATANVDLNAFEADFLDYLHSYEFTDSTIENQYFSFHFYTADLAFIPLPQDEKQRERFKSYHQKLFTQEAFLIDTTKIIPYPDSWDSVSLIKDIMRAYPDSLMFAPGRTPLDIKLGQLIEEEGQEDQWFLSVYAGVFKYNKREIREKIVRYSPVDFRSSAFRKWYALFILQEMFNRDDIKSGINQVKNEYRAYPDYNNKINSYLHFFLFNAENQQTRITASYYDGERIQNFSPNNFHFEVFNNPLFQSQKNGFRIQLKINPEGNFIREAAIIDPKMEPKQEEFLLDALSKYKFTPFLIKYPDSLGFGWIQITCKQRDENELVEEEEYVTFEIVEDLDLESISETEEEEIYSFPDKDAVFIHGAEELENYIKKRIPLKSEIETEERGTVYIRITVNKEGDWEGLKVIRGVNEELDGIAQDIVHTMPHWIPAELDGEPVRSYVTIPIHFKK